MPNKDGTGPDGEGSKIGRQMGECEGAVERSFGRGCRRGRPCRGRRIRGNPDARFFKPIGVKACDLVKISLKMDEFEAIRLVDFKQLSQSEAGVKMNISQPTLSRILDDARRKIAEAIVEGKAIKIE